MAILAKFRQVWRNFEISGEISPIAKVVGEMIRANKLTQL